MAPVGRKRKPVHPKALSSLFHEEALFDKSMWRWHHHKSEKQKKMSVNQQEEDLLSSTELNSAEHYEKNGKAKTVLFAMLIGLTSDDGRQLGDTDIPPHKDAKFRKLLVPTAAHLKAEVSRRAALEGIDTPSCKYWNTEKLRTWLKENVIQQPIEVEWLKTQEKRIFDLHTKAEEEKNSTQCKDWGDLKPWCRLYCVYFSDQVRPLLLTQNDVMDRQELDARNNEARPPTIWDAVAEMFNDENAVFELPAKPELHHLFAQPMNLSFDDMPGPINADEAKRRIGEARARLMRVASKWELSGNGFGQRTVDDDEYGHIEEEQLMDGDNRARFLEGVGTEHLLILWDLADHEGVLAHALNKLDPDVAVDCDNIHADSSEVQNPRTIRLSDHERDCKHFRDSLADSMKTMSCASLHQQLRESEDKIIKLNEQIWVATAEGAVEFYEACLEREKDRNQESQEELKRVKRQRVEA